jgi:hypothetical protein
MSDAKKIVKKGPVGKTLGIYTLRETAATTHLRLVLTPQFAGTVSCWLRTGNSSVAPADGHTQDVRLQECGTHLIKPIQCRRISEVYFLLLDQQPV